MADAKISQLPAATTPLAGTEKAEIVQGGVNKQVDVSEFGGGTVISVTGTTNRITSTGGTTPVIDIDAAYDAAVTAEIAAAGNSKSNALITFRTETASHTLDATDLASINAGATLNINMNVATPNTLTLPQDSDQAFPVGTVVFVDWVGAGQTTFVAGTGATLQGNKYKISEQYAGASAKKVAANTWRIQGSVTN